MESMIDTATWWSPSGIDPNDDSAADAWEALGVLPEGGDSGAAETLDATAYALPPPQRHREDANSG